MNITADPGLPYTISHNYFTILNITKNKHPSIWSRNPSKINLKRKDDKCIIFSIKPSKNQFLLSLSSIQETL